MKNQKKRPSPHLKKCVPTFPLGSFPLKIVGGKHLQKNLKRVEQGNIFGENI
jgi:hypothetical protein